MKKEEPKEKPTVVQLTKIEWGTNIHPAIQIIEHFINQKKKHG